MAARGKRGWERALVTGASGGIGAAYARALAAEGTHLVLVARNVERLEKLANECRTDHGVEVEVLPADLADQRQLAHVESRLSGSPRLDLLINNAGIGTFGAFHQQAVTDELREIDLNVGALVRLTHAAIASMTRNGSGTVLNLSSIMALAPFPGSATYAASKAFVASFSEALHEELRGTGVTVTAAMPGIVRTEFIEHSNAHHLDGVPGFAKLKPELVTQATLRAARKGKAVSIPGVGYRIMAAMVGATPRAVLRRFSGVSARSKFGALHGGPAPVQTAPQIDKLYPTKETL
jgi:short-subunit dehydrogenase